MGSFDEPQRIRVQVDPDLEDLIPAFLENRHTDIATIRLALESGDYQRIFRVGHNLKGDSGALGFTGLTDLGRDLERAAEQLDGAEVRAQLERLVDYLERVEIVRDGV